MDLRTLRVDQNGSLIRPAPVLDAFERHAHGQASDDELRAAQDDAIRAVIRQQEAIGLPVVSDGEFRRRNFQESFGKAVSGYDVPAQVATLTDWREPNRPLHRTEQNFDAAGPAITTRRPVVDRLRFRHNVPTASPSALPGRNRKPSTRISTNSSPMSSRSSAR
jgi:5-methyltetrahydropteroyltriglutamate--homocysteine methyltransferase